MRYDADLLKSVEDGVLPPTLRFFSFDEPTVSFGRLQKLENISALVPAGWAVVQRPTGGGIVYHQNDLCFSLTWKAGAGPLPLRPQDQYRWIHSVVLEALGADCPIRMAACCDVQKPAEPFAVQTCFRNPVGYDLLDGTKKVVGGALRCTRRATLYQGSIQMMPSAAPEAKLLTEFAARLNGGA